jgi:hypothetical protein
LVYGRNRYLYALLGNPGGLKCGRRIFRLHPKLNVDIFANSTWDLGVDFIKETTMDKTIIGSYIRSWERPGDLPRVIEIVIFHVS